VSALSGFILVLLGFGFLIFIHELGHFLAAKWAGIRADGFAIGMGPCVASYRRGVGLCAGSADAKVVRAHGKRPIEMTDAQREGLGIGETEYSLRLLPLGGYVRMLGQEDGNPGATSSDARSFGMATIPRRAVVILAGIAANLALAIVLFLVAFLAGVRFPAPTVGFVVPGSPAATATSATPGAATGLQAGDRVVSIDGDETRTFIDLRVAAAMAKPEQALAIELERRDYFLNAQGGRASATVLEETSLPAKTDAVRGIAWLPRLLPKARAKMRGELPSSLMYGCGGDRRFFREHNILPAEFLALTWRHENDPTAIIDWVIRRKAEAR